MSIKFKVIQRGEPGVTGGGQQKFYAVAVSSQRMNIKELSTEIERMSTVSRTDVVAVLTALVQLVPEKLANGTIVQLGDLGYFRPSIGSKGEATAAEVNANSITSNKVLFTPGREIKDVLSIAKYTKVSSDTPEEPEP